MHDGRKRESWAPIWGPGPLSNKDGRKRPTMGFLIRPRPIVKAMPMTSKFGSRWFLTVICCPVQLDWMGGQDCVPIWSEGNFDSEEESRLVERMGRPKQRESGPIRPMFFAQRHWWPPRARIQALIIYPSRNVISYPYPHADDAITDDTHHITAAHNLASKVSRSRWDERGRALWLMLHVSHW